MISLFKPKPQTSSKFSEFIRKSSSEEKKRVYTAVIRAAVERQRATLSAVGTPAKPNTSVG